MSVAEIINELPKLSEAERRIVREKLVELSATNEDVRQCNEAALQGALMLDHLEEQYARAEKG